MLRQAGRFVPFLAWIRTYQRGWLIPDVVAGVTTWGAAVPTAFAFAQMAGMPPATGLYSAMMAMLLYGLLGSSRHAKVTASSTMSIMSAAAIGAIAVGDSGHFYVLSSALAMVVGLLILLAGIAKLGVIADFMAKPVVTGFVFGLAINIIISQSGRLLGFRAPGDTSVQQLYYLLTNLSRTHLLTLLVGLGTIVFILLWRRWLPKIPAPLAALIAGIVVAALFNLGERGVAITGEISTALPGLSFPTANLREWVNLVIAAVGIVFLAVGESLGAARAFATRHNTPLDANQEMIAIGAANIGTGLFQGFTVDTSMSITATSDSAGSKTQVTSLVVALLMLLTIVFLAPLFYHLPSAVLGAIVIMAVLKLIDIPEMMRYYRTRRWDFAVAVVAAVGVLTTSVLGGLLLAVLLSLVMIIYRTSHPRVARLGRWGVTNVYGDMERHPNYSEDPEVRILRVDEAIYFYNAGAITAAVQREAAQDEPPPRVLILDLRATSELDVASIDALLELYGWVQSRGIDLRFAYVRSSVIDRLEKADAFKVIDRTHLHPNLDSAIQAARKELAEQPAPPALVHEET